MILVAGATGMTGRAVIAELGRLGVKARAMVRDPGRAAGLASDLVELVQGDLDDTASLNAALAGVERAFLVSSIGPKAIEQQSAFLDAAKKAGVRQLARLSATGAQPGAKAEILRQHATIDLRLMTSGLRFTILQPNSFYQNFLGWAGSVKEQGKLQLPFGAAKISFIDVRDVAAVAAKCLTEPGHERRTYVLTGPEALGGAEVASKISVAAGKEIAYVDVPASAVVDAMRQAGVSDWDASRVGELLVVFAGGGFAQVTETVSKILGRSPTTFDQFVREHEDAFR